jgi:hypothetical protein
MTSRSIPRTRHSSWPVFTSYACTSCWLLTMSSSRPPALMTMGVPQPTVCVRSVFQIGLPVFLSYAATNAPVSSVRRWSW